MYKLAENVTEEMLIECGFMMSHDFTLIGGLRKMDGKEIYVTLSWGSYPSQNGTICWNDDETIEDITPYIQDLIDKGMVVKC